MFNETNKPNPFSANFSSKLKQPRAMADTQSFSPD